MHGAKYRNAARTCDVIFVNSRVHRRARSSSCSACPPEKVVVAYPGVDGFAAEGERADLGRPYVLTVATLEPRKNLETLLAAPLPEGHALAVVGAAGWGPQPTLDRPDVIRLGYVDDDGARAPLPRRGGVRLPVALRGLRDPDRRGDGERRSRRRVRARVDGRGGGRRGRARRPRRPAGDRRRARGGDPAPRRARPARARPRGALPLDGDGPHDAGAFLRCASGSTSRRSSRRRPGTARYVRGLLAHNEYERLAFGGPDAARHGRPRRLVVPARAPARGPRPRRAPLPDLPGPCTERRPRGRNGPRPRRPAPPRDVQPVDAALQPPCRSQGGAGGEARDRGLRVHEAARSSSCSASPEERIRVIPNGVEAVVHAGRPERRRATTCSRSGRSSRARTCAAAQQAAQRLGVELASRRRAGAGAACRSTGGWGASPTRSSRRSTAARAASSTRRSTRASGSRCSRRWPAARRS